MSKQKREEEKKILAEMEEAMKEQAKQFDGEKEQTPTNSEEKKAKKGLFGLLEDKTPEKLHCRRCKTLMEDGVCPTCGFRTYVPMDKVKQQKIRLILTCVCVVAFVVLFVWLQMRS